MIGPPGMLNSHGEEKFKPRQTLAILGACAKMGLTRCAAILSDDHF
jgi:hypothetical protein